MPTTVNNASSLGLDPITLLFTIAVLGFLLSMVSFSFSKNWKTEDYGLGAWGKAMFALGGSSLLFYFRGFAPWGITYLLPNLLVIGVAPFILIAYARLFEVKPSYRFMGLTSAFGISGVLTHYFFLETPRSVAVFTLCLAIAIQLGMVIVMLVRHGDSQSKLSKLISCSASALLAIALTIRAISGTFGDVSSALFEAKPLPIGMSIFGAIFAVALSVSFFSMVGARNQRESLAYLRRDGLTGLFTRTTFFEMAEEFDTRYANEQYAVVMVDIDHFKSINDTYGHKGGDITLAHVGRLIANSVRLTDIAGRYGGEEFCLILRGCGESDAAIFANRLVSDAGKQLVRICDDGEVRFTLSVGYAVRSASTCLGERVEVVKDVIDRADQALYRAKSGGRNQAIPASPPNLMTTASA